MKSKDETIRISDALRAGLVKLAKKIDLEEEDAYYVKVKASAEFENYWRGNQYLYWTGEKFITPRENGDDDAPNFERVYNIYRAHGESIIAALGIEVPQLTFFPHDSNEPDDLLTAKTYTKLSKVVCDDNRAQLMIIRALSVLYKDGLIFGYNYHERDEKYGSVPVEEVTTQKVISTSYSCPNCNSPMETGDPAPCPSCGINIEPLVNEEEGEVPINREMAYYPKGKEILEIYSHANVKVPMYAKSQSKIGYLRFSDEFDRALVIELFGIKPDNSNSSDYDRSLRMQIIYGGSDTNDNLITVRRYWLRPWYYNNLENDELVAECKRLFKDGCHFTLIGSELVEPINESLDSHWTLSENPLEKVLYADPIGAPMKSVQDKLNEEDRLTIATMEYGIPFSIIDTDILDFTKLGKTRARPGDMYPGKRPFNGNIGDGVYTVTPARLSQEHSLIRKQTVDDGQFAVGSYPSIYGGPSEGGSRTYAEYAMSRSQALQRLSVHWKTIVDWWIRLMEKAVASRARNLDEDEQFTDKKGDTFITVWIKRTELAGKVGKVVSEVSDKLPVSWMQKKDQLFQLMQLNNEAIDSVVYHPENAGLLALLFGFPELYIPGADQRTKQLREIRQMEQGQPVLVDPTIDDHQVHSEVCASYLVSEQGLLLKDSPDERPIYDAILQHKQQHDIVVQQQVMMEQSQAEQNQIDEPKENETNGNQG